MILILDLTNSGTAHVAINCGLMQAAAVAFPQSRVRMHAEPEHLAAVREDPAMLGLPNVDFAPIALSPHYRWKTHVVSARRFAQEWRTLRACLRAAPKGEPHLIVLASATPTAILAALLIARVSRDPVWVQVGMHGNLNEVVGWRARNPLLRRLDLRAMLARPNLRMRMLVFEPPIREALETIIPGSGARTDVLPHPVDAREAAGHPPPEADGPLRVGLVGLATEAKGLTPYLETARLFRQRHGDRIEFHIVGGRPGDIPPERFADIAHEMPAGHIPRSLFVERMARLHYVVLPLDPSYYDLSPSGGMIDAVAWCKPIIASRVRVTESLFRQAGDIGDLCDGLEAMQAALERAVTQRDPDRYARQVAALARLRDARAPEAAALAYRDIVRRGFPGFAGTAAPQAMRSHSGERAGGRA